MSDESGKVSLPGFPAGRRSPNREQLLAKLRSDPRRFLQVAQEPFFAALSELQDIFFSSTVQFWSARGARYQFLPVTTTSVSSPSGLGSDSTPVAVSLAGQTTYLSDSMQFLLEFGCRIADGGTYYVMPSFRGEPIDATHLNEFTHMEAELPVALPELISLIEEFLLHVCKSIVEQFRGPAGANFDLAHVETFVEAGTGAFRVMTFDKVVEELGSTADFVRILGPGARTLTRAGEREAHARFGDFLWITHWDHLSVPFYQRLMPGDPPKALCADLFFGPGEVVGCGERHMTGAEVVQALALHQVKEADYQWYIDMKTELPLRTSGFGLGVDRFLMWVVSHPDIRDMQLLLREHGVRHAP